MYHLSTEFCENRLRHDWRLLGSVEMSRIGRYEDYDDSTRLNSTGQLSWVELSRIGRYEQGFSVDAVKQVRTTDCARLRLTLHPTDRTSCNKGIDRLFLTLNKGWFHDRSSSNVVHEECNVWKKLVGYICIPEFKILDLKTVLWWVGCCLNAALFSRTIFHSLTE